MEPSYSAWGQFYTVYLPILTEMWGEDKIKKGKHWGNHLLFGLEYHSCCPKPFPPTEGRHWPWELARHQNLPREFLLLRGTRRSEEERLSKHTEPPLPCWVIFFVPRGALARGNSSFSRGWLGFLPVFTAWARYKGTLSTASTLQSQVLCTTEAFSTSLLQFDLAPVFLAHLAHQYPNAKCTEGK